MPSRESPVAKSHKASVVDGYTAIKVVQHAAKGHDRAAPAATPPSDTPGAESPDLKQLGAHISRTAVPVKHVIECYECGYKFQLHGRAASTNCSKCRVTLDLTDHVIDGKWNKSFKTCGTVHLAAKGVLQSGEIVANDFILEGTIEAGTVRAMRKLELRPGARFSETNVSAPDLVIAPGATIAFIAPAEFRDVEIAGTLRANLHATGIVTVKAAGLLQGEFHGEHLIVEEGGGLLAAVQIDR